MRIIIYLLSFLLLSSCIKLDPQTTAEETRFDIPAYFKKEITRLEKMQNLKVEKITLQNGQKERKEMQIQDWKKELTLFSKYNIHKPQVLEEYDEQKEDLDGGKYSLTYQTKNPKLGLKEVVIIYNAAQEVEEIRLEQKANNQVYESSYLMSYIPSKGYLISKQQKVVLFDENRFEVELRFLNDN
jgi:hypothetical protein